MYLNSIKQFDFESGHSKEIECVYFDFEIFLKYNGNFITSQLKFTIQTELIKFF